MIICAILTAWVRIRSIRKQVNTNSDEPNKLGKRLLNIHKMQKNFRNSYNFFFEDFFKTFHRNLLRISYRNSFSSFTRDFFNHASRNSWENRLNFFVDFFQRLSEEYQKKNLERIPFQGLFFQEFLGIAGFFQRFSREYFQRFHQKIILASLQEFYHEHL